MRIISATPETFQSTLNASKAGDVIQLSAGIYPDVYKLHRRKAAPNAPIVIEANPALPKGSVKISQERDAECYRPQANEIAAKRYEKTGKYPGLWDVSHKARLRLSKCAHIILRNLDFERSWPTHLYINKSTNITIENCRFIDASFCILANGRRTRNITIEGCSWTQDREAKRIWSGIAWKRIHGHPEHKNCPWPVKDDDFRLFDGDFFRATGIWGGVTIRHCDITNAFNGVHAEGNGDNRKTNRDFHIHNCRFVQIRDNAIEPEKNAFNWSIHDNLFLDNHAPVSFDCNDLSHIYLFANLFAFRSIQGPSGSDPKDIDCNRGGKVFKLKGTPQKPHGPNYAFHNSLITRLKYMPKGIFEGLQHFNNAMHFIPQAGSNFDAFPRFFGALKGAAPDDRFTDQWSDQQGFAIKMDADVVFLPDWPAKQRAAGYAIGPEAQSADPGFARIDFTDAAPEIADFATAPDGPCARAGIGCSVMQPDGTRFTLPPGQDIGAVQRNPTTNILSLFQGPAFTTTQEDLSA